MVKTNQVDVSRSGRNCLENSIGGLNSICLFHSELGNPIFGRFTLNNFIQAVQMGQRDSFDLNFILLSLSAFKSGRFFNVTVSNCYFWPLFATMECRRTAFFFFQFLQNELLHKRSIVASLVHCLLLFALTVHWWQLSHGKIPCTFVCMFDVVSKYWCRRSM